MKSPLIGTSWKMNLTASQAAVYCATLRKLVEDLDDRTLFVLPPFPSIPSARDLLAGSNIAWGAQDVHPDEAGAHTGDVSWSMLVDAGCTHVIIGHSERRHDHGETDEQVNRKVKAALAANLTPIVCVGEMLAERESGRTGEVLKTQFENGLAGLTASDFSRIIIAYEPIWAIGTGRTATPVMAAETHRLLRDLARQKFGEKEASAVRILYGGSVKPENVGGLMAQEEIDGALVGGASLKPDSFAALINYPR